MLRQRLSYNPSIHNGDYDFTPKKRHYKSEDGLVISERRIAIFALLFSLMVIVIKLYFTHGHDIRNLLIEQRLVSYKTITEDGEVFVQHAWKSAVKHSNLWLPVLCGFISSYFTWCIVYLDSSVPGVLPPSPLSPSQHKIRSGHTFHINYIFAILIGLLVFIYMYWKGVSIEYSN